MEKLLNMILPESNFDKNGKPTVRSYIAYNELTAIVRLIEQITGIGGITEKLDNIMGKNIYNMDIKKPLNYEFYLVCRKDKNGSPIKNAKWILHFKWRDKSKSSGYSQKTYTLNKENCGIDFPVKSKNAKDLEKEKLELQSNSNYVNTVISICKIFEIEMEQGGF